MKNFSRYYGFLGLAMIVLSFSHWYFPFNAWTLFFAHGIFVIGNILFFDYLSFRFQNYSILFTIFKKSEIKNTVKKLFFIGIYYSIILELFLHWLGKLWAYPYWNQYWYFPILPGFAIYALYMVETYLGVKAILSRLISDKKNRINFEPLFKIVLFVSALSAFGSAIFLVNKLELGDLNYFFSINFIPKAQNIMIQVALVGLPFYLIVDYLLYKKKKISILFGILQGRVLSLISILLTGWVVGMVYEVFNTKALFWQYGNVWLQDYSVLGVPFLVSLFWPTQYFVALSIYYYFFDETPEK